MLQDIYRAFHYNNMTLIINILHLKVEYQSFIYVYKRVVMWFLNFFPWSKNGLINNNLSYV